MWTDLMGVAADRVRCLSAVRVDSDRGGLKATDIFSLPRKGQLDRKKHPLIQIERQKLSLKIKTDSNAKC